MKQEERNELLKELVECRELDTEEAHQIGDKVVAKALRKLGFQELADEYDAQKEEWWYS